MIEGHCHGRFHTHRKECREFEGFISISCLRQLYGCNCILPTPGVYLVYRESFLNDRAMATYTRSGSLVTGYVVAIGIVMLVVLLARFIGIPSLAWKDGDILGAGR